MLTKVSREIAVWYLPKKSHINDTIKLQKWEIKSQMEMCYSNIFPPDN